jgi:hypothetical protein
LHYLYHIYIYIICNYVLKIKLIYDGIFSF